MDFSTFVEQVSGSALQLLAVLFTALSSWAITKISSYFKEKALATKDEQMLNKIDKYEKFATSSVENIVVSLQESLVKDLKEKSADGKLTQEEIEQIQNTTMELFKKQITTTGLEALQEAHADVDVWLQLVVDKILANYKNQSPELFKSDMIVAIAAEKKKYENKTSLPEPSEEDEIVEKAQLFLSETGDVVVPEEKAPIEVEMGRNVTIKPPIVAIPVESDMFEINNPE